MPNFPNRDASGTPSERMVVVTVAGKLNDAAFQRAKKAAEFLADAEGEFTANVVSLLPFDYELFVQGILPAFPDVREHDGAVLCYLGEPNGGATYLGHLDPFMAWCRETYDYEDETDEDIYARLAETHMRGFIEKTGREYVTMEVCADGAVEGTLLIELFTDIAPKTCANFRAFALGEEEKTAGRTYEGCPVHRVVRDGWFQTGDVLEGNGRGVTSVYGDTFADETFKVHHDTPGVLAMAGAKKHTNGCQFYVAQAPLPFLDGRRVGFGRVVDGLGLMRKINAEELTFAERPVRDVRIGKCARFTAGVEGGGTAAEE